MEKSAALKKIRRQPWSFLALLAVGLGTLDALSWQTLGSGIPLKIQIFTWWLAAIGILRIEPKISGWVGVGFLSGTVFFSLLDKPFASEQAALYAYYFFWLAVLQSFLTKHYHYPSEKSILLPPAILNPPESPPLPQPAGARLGLVHLSFENQQTTPPSGLVSLATYLKKYLPQVETRIIDINFENVLETIKTGNFDVVGINTMTIQYGRAIELAKRIKAWKNLPILVGGTHISTLPTSLSRSLNIGVIGEGEETLRELMALFCHHRRFRPYDLEKIAGLVFWKDNQLITTKPRKLIEPLDRIPIPDRHFIRPEYFRRSPLPTWGEFGIEHSLLTSRGCPYNCVFCSTKQLWKKVRFHSIEHVVGEVKELVENYGVTHLQIWDDLFTINRDRLRKLARRLKEEGLLQKVKFNCQPRANLIDDELCQILKDLNVTIVLFGFESGSEPVLQYLKAGTVTVEQNRQAITTCVQHGLKVQGSVIFGSPGEKIEDMEKTLDFLRFALKNGAHRLWSFVMTPFPATQIWEVAKARGKVNEDESMNWNQLSHQSIDNPLLLDPDIPVEEFKRIFLEGRKILNKFKWNKIFSFIKDSPFETAAVLIRHPAEYLTYLFSKRNF